MGSGSSPGYDRYAQRYRPARSWSRHVPRLSPPVQRLMTIDTKIRDAKSVAPFDGVITKKLVEVGDPVQPGQPLLKFADMSKLQIKVEVPARLMPGVKKGMVFPARLDVGDVDIQAASSRSFRLPIRTVIP